MESAGISYKVRSRLLLIASGLIMLLSWPLALKKTWQEIALNKELKGKDEGNLLSYNPNHLKEKQEILGSLLTRYTLDSAEWKNEFWMKVSGAASRSKISVNYNPDLRSSTSVPDSALMNQRISFVADYRDLVLLMDTLEKTQGVGFLCSASFKKVKSRRAEVEDKLYLNLVFGALKGDN